MPEPTTLYADALILLAKTRRQGYVTNQLYDVWLANLKKQYDAASTDEERLAACYITINQCTRQRNVLPGRWYTPDAT